MERPLTIDELATTHDGHLPSSRWPARLMAGAGMLIVAIALLVLLGWLLRSVVLTSLTQKFPAMQINTALALLACGGGLWGFSRRHGRMVASAGGIVGLIGLATLSEHLFDIDLGIDRPFGDPFFTQGVMRPGRMAPVTALGLSLLGSALLAMVRSPLLGWRAVYTGIIGALTATLGVFSIAGLPLGLGETYGWGNLIRLAPMTAFCFLIIGASLTSWVLLRHHTDRLPLAEARRSIIGYSVIGTGIVALFSAALVAVPLYVTMQNHERTALLRLAQGRAALCSDYLQHVEDLARQISASTPDAALATVMTASNDIAGLTRLHQDGTALATVGLALPADHPARSSGHRHGLGDPLMDAGTVLLVVTSPVIASDGVQRARDVVLIHSIDLLRALIRHPDEDVSLSAHLLVPTAHGLRRFVPKAGKDGLAMVSAAADPQATRSEGGVRLLDGRTSTPVLEAVVAIPGSAWQVVVSVQAGAAFGTINHNLLMCWRWSAL